jgi:uncharacterized OB-fold protein
MAEESKERKCRNCGTTVWETHMYCSNCGQVVP